MWRGLTLEEAREVAGSHEEPGLPNLLFPLFQDEQEQEGHNLGLVWLLEQKHHWHESVPRKIYDSVSDSTLKMSYPRKVASVFVIHNTSYICPLSNHRFAHSGVVEAICLWLLPRETNLLLWAEASHAVQEASIHHPLGSWRSLVLSGDIVKLEGDFWSCWWLGGTISIYWAGTEMSEMVTAVQVVVTDVQGSHQVWMQVKNPIYTFLRLEQNYVLHINTNLFAQFPQYPSLSINETAAGIGDLLCFFPKVFPELVTTSPNHIMVFESPTGHV